MRRKYTHVKAIEKEIFEMKSQGKTRLEIAEYFNLSVKQVENLITQHNNRQKRMEAGIVPRRRGRPPKGVQVMEQEKGYEIKRLNYEMNRIKMENELLYNATLKPYFVSCISLGCWLKSADVGNIRTWAQRFMYTPITLTATSMPNTPSKNGLRIFLISTPRREFCTFRLFMICTITPSLPIEWARNNPLTSCSTPFGMLKQKRPPRRCNSTATKAFNTLHTGILT